MWYTFFQFWFTSTHPLQPPQPPVISQQKRNKTRSRLVLLSRQSHREQDRLGGPNQPYRISAKVRRTQKNMLASTLPLQNDVKRYMAKNRRNTIPHQPPTDTPTSSVAKPDKLGILNVTKRENERETSRIKPATRFFPRNLKKKILRMILGRLLSDETLFTLPLILQYHPGDLVRETLEVAIRSGRNSGPTDRHCVDGHPRELRVEVMRRL